jgi:hypothetical protein
VLVGIACFTGMLEIGANLKGDWMLPVMLLYFGGIGFTGIGGLGLVVLFFKHLFSPKTAKHIAHNQSSEPALASGTSPAGQEPRLP